MAAQSIFALTLLLSFRVFAADHFREDLTPGALGSARIGSEYSSFNCFTGNVKSETFQSGNLEPSFLVETWENNPNLSSYEVRITMSFYSSWHTKKTLIDLAENPEVSNNPVCANDILLGTEVAGTFRLIRTFSVDSDKRDQVKALLQTIASARDYFAFSLPVEIHAYGVSSGYSISDAGIDLSKLWISTTPDDAVAALPAIRNQLDSLYPKDRVQNLDISENDLVKVYLGTGVF